MPGRRKLQKCRASLRCPPWRPRPPPRPSHGRDGHIPPFGKKTWRIGSPRFSNTCFAVSGTVVKSAGRGESPRGQRRKQSIVWPSAFGRRPDHGRWPHRRRSPDRRGGRDGIRLRESADPPGLRVWPWRVCGLNDDRVKRGAGSGKQRSIDMIPPRRLVPASFGLGVPASAEVYIPAVSAKLINK